MDLSGLSVWVGDYGPTVGLVLMLGLMMARGWLVPGRTVDRLVEAERRVTAAERARADEWRGAHDALKVRAEVAEQTAGTLLTGFEAHGALLRSIQAEAMRRAL
jgi:hypothetical protein